MDTKEGKPARNKRSFWSWRRVLILVGSLAFLGVLLAAVPLTVIYLAQPVRVEGVGMSSTLNDGDRVLVGKKVGDLQRGDIIIFYFPKDTSKSYIKRVIALPGEVLEIRASQTFINGFPLDELYVDPRTNRATRDMGPVLIEPQHYFVMGDNRDNSSDSRYWGSVNRSFIYGKVLGRYWPLV